jgi:hypothetical protein
MSDQDDDSSTPAANETAEQAPAAGSNPSASIAYRAVVLAVFGLGSLAVVGGLAGTYVALTGGLGGGEEFDVLGAYECETFEGDPAVVPETEYAIEREVLTPTEVATFNGTVDGETVRVTLETTGPLLAATANQPDGRVIPVQTEEDTLTVARNSTEPFRLWVDAVGEEGTVTRMRLDICPPQS